MIKIIKKYLFTIIPFILGVSCFVAFNIIGSKVDLDGTLVEPFYLIPTGFLSRSLITSLIMSTLGLFHNPTNIDKITFGMSLSIILLSVSYLFLSFSYLHSLDMKEISMTNANITYE